MLNPWKNSFKVSVCAFLPILAYWSLKEFIFTRPFWVYYDHIETIYYYTSMELTHGLMPHNIDNPGTPVQLIGALLIYLLGDNPADYPAYLMSSHILILILSFSATVFVVHRTMSNINFYLSVSSIWFFFCFPTAILFLQVLAPEPFYYIFGLLTISALFWVFDNNHDITDSKIFLAGLTIGILVSIKFTFLSWVLAYAIALAYSGSRHSWKAFFYRPALGVLGIGLAFVIVTFPIWDGYPYMFKWLTALSTRDGSYGSGESGLPSIATALSNWRAFVFSSKIWLFLFFLATASTLFYRRVKKNAIRESTDRIVLFTIFIFSATFFSLLLVARMHQQRYLLPIGLCGLMMSILCFQTIPALNKKYFSISIAGILFLLLIKTMMVDFQTHQLKTKAAVELHDTVANKIEFWSKERNIENPVVIYGWRVPAPSFALRQHAYEEKYQQKIDQTYPQEGHYVPWGMREPQPVQLQTFRVPSGKEHWDFAVIRDEYINGLPISGFSRIDKVENYWILGSEEK